MTWYRCDDQLGDHPKVMSLDAKLLPAMGLWLMCGVYCAKHLTDGKVPRKVVAMYDGEKLVKDLERAGLFEPIPTGWLMHDYLIYNPSREQVAKERAERIAAGKAGAKARWMAEPMAEAIAPAMNGAEHDARQTDAPYPYPVPVPVVTQEYVLPADLYQSRARRKSLSQKERDWLEDLHVRFSRNELVRAIKQVEVGPDFLKRIDAFLEGRTA